MSSSFKYRNGLGNSAAYQVSGIPFATGSLSVPTSSAEPIRIQFPKVTSWFTVVNRSNQHVRVGFSANGVKGDNYITIHEENHPTSNSFNLKVTEIYLLSNGGATTNDVDVIAGLTTIDVESIANNWSGSAGVG